MDWVKRRVRKPCNVVIKRVVFIILTEVANEGRDYHYLMHPSQAHARSQAHGVQSCTHMHFLQGELFPF